MQAGQAMLYACFADTAAALSNAGHTIDTWRRLFPFDDPTLTTLLAAKDKGKDTAQDTRAAKGGARGDRPPPRARSAHSKHGEQPTAEQSIRHHPGTAPDRSPDTGNEAERLGPIPTPAPAAALTTKTRRKRGDPTDVRTARSDMDRLTISDDAIARSQRCDCHSRLLAMLPQCHMSYARPGYIVPRRVLTQYCGSLSLEATTPVLRRCASTDRLRRGSSGSCALHRREQEWLCFASA
jgi:hypothetical protein